MKIGFIGLGIMGSRMARRLMDAGHTLKLYNRTERPEMMELEAAGAKRSATASEAATDVDVIITMLANPDAVKAVATGPEGLIAGAKEGSLWMDCSTVDPETSRSVARAAKEKGLRFLDAPVAGSREPAANGELLFLVGGDETDVAEVQPLLDIMGRKTIHTGPNGAGSSMKLVVNYLLAQSLLTAGEAVRIGTSLGLSKKQVLDTVTAAPVTAPVVGAYRDRLDSETNETHFPLKHMLKDLRLAGLTVGDALPLLQDSTRFFGSLEEKEGDRDFTIAFHRT